MSDAQGNWEKVWAVEGLRAFSRRATQLQEMAWCLHQIERMRVSDKGSESYENVCVYIYIGFKWEKFSICGHFAQTHIISPPSS